MAFYVSFQDLIFLLKVLNSLIRIINIYPFNFKLGLRLLLRRFKITSDQIIVQIMHHGLLVLILYRRCFSHMLFRTGTAYSTRNRLLSLNRYRWIEIAHTIETRLESLSCLNLLRLILHNPLC